MRCLIGGVIAGAGVAAMHYIGVLALHSPADMTWDKGLLLVAVAIVAAGTPLWLAMRIQLWQTSKQYRADTLALMD